MNNPLLRLSLIFTVLSIISLSCKPKKSELIKPRLQVEEDWPMAESASIVDNQTVTVQGKYSTVGSLIPTNIFITQDITYKNGSVIRDKSSTKSSGMTMDVTQEYDEKKRLITLRSEHNGEVSVIQTNTYTDDDLLLKEFRLESNDTGYDTTIYEYHYPNDRPNPLQYYRTNNGTKVTEMTLKTDGNKEVLEEKAVGSPNYFGLTITTREKDDKGNVLQEQQTYYTSDWNDKTKIDTTVYEPTFYKYDHKDRLIKQQSANTIGLNGTVESFYDDNGIITKKIISKSGRGKQVVKYKRIQ